MKKSSFLYYANEHNFNISNPNYIVDVVRLTQPKLFGTINFTDGHEFIPYTIHFKNGIGVVENRIGYKDFPSLEVTRNKIVVLTANSIKYDIPSKAILLAMHLQNGLESQYLWHLPNDCIKSGHIHIQDMYNDGLIRNCTNNNFPY